MKKKKKRILFVCGLVGAKRSRAFVVKMLDKKDACSGFKNYEGNVRIC